MAKGCFDVQKKIILERDCRFFAAVLSEMNKDNADARKVSVSVRITTKYFSYKMYRLTSLLV